MSAARSVMVVGMGRMGRPMSKHLREHGFEVTTYDVADDAVAWARGQGFDVAETPRAGAEVSEVVLILTGREAEVEAVCSGPAGLLEAPRDGQILMIGSTVSPAFAKDLAARAGDVGIEVLDTPITRGERAAIEANVLWLAGGPDAALERCRPLMKSCGSDIYHLGEVGTGQVAKALNNMLLWAALCADHEALALADRFDVDLNVLRSALTNSSASNWALVHWDDMGNIPWAVKDMDIVLDMAKGAEVSIPMGALIWDQVGIHHRAAATGP
jgi:3-hydroxyisobutyrate dehydrogenase-like beta-hydroxyacid dehydrogenase